MKKRLIRGQALTAMPSYRRTHTVSAKGASELELDGDGWLPLCVHNAWQAQARAMLRVCGPWQHAPQSPWRENESLKCHGVDHSK